jgi:hypothetical protein
MDNGRQDSGEPLIWIFIWEKMPEAQAYHLYVKKNSSEKPVIDQKVGEAYFIKADYGYIINPNCEDWIWKVRPLIDGTWREWSETRSFNVEPLNTDPAPVTQ